MLIVDKTLRVMSFHSWSQMTFYLRYYISSFTRLMATKLGRVLTSRRRFRMQTPKSPPTVCFPFSLLFSRRYVWTNWQKFFVYFLPFVTLDICDQYRIYFIGHTDKLLCLRSEILCVRAWNAMCFRDNQ